jgi:hypothetical protein
MLFTTATTRERMSREGSNTPVRFVDDDGETFLARRAALLDELVTPRTTNDDDDVQPTTPLDAYMLLFGAVPALGIRKRVRSLYAAVATAGSARRRAEPGRVYVFRDSRDDDPMLGKIGSTTRAVRRRIAEWRTALGANDTELVRLFSTACIDVRLAERLVHELLFFEWQPWRERADTGEALVEYFRVADLVALRWLLRAVARHVDWFTRLRARPP